MQNETVKNVKIAIVLVVLFIVIVTGYFIYTSISRSGKIPVTINAVPSDAIITLNDTKVSTGTIYLAPGSYKIEASKEGFADFSETTHIDTTNKLISVLMTAESNEAKKWAKENRNDYLIAEGEAGKAAREQGEIFRTKNPIVNLLPYRSLLYTIGYRNDPTDSTGSSIIIEIDAGQGYRQQAIHQIQQWGYDPTDFKINFRDYENPFES